VISRTGLRIRGSRSAGFGDGEIVEIIATTVPDIFTNYLDRACRHGYQPTSRSFTAAPTEGWPEECPLARAMCQHRRTIVTGSAETRPPLPPFSRDTAILKGPRSRRRLE
jgi:hypothetical protein